MYAPGNPNTLSSGARELQYGKIPHVCIGKTCHGVEAYYRLGWGPSISKKWLRRWIRFKHEENSCCYRAAAGHDSGVHVYAKGYDVFLDPAKSGTVKPFPTPLGQSPLAKHLPPGRRHGYP